MLPGKTYSADELIHIARQRAWLLVFLLLVGLGVGLEISRRLPSLYRSEALLLFEAQRVPDEYVKSMPTGGVDDRLATLQSQIMSRSRLERIITDQDLYKPQRRRMPLEDVVQQMRTDIDVKSDSKASFSVSYVSQDAKTAQRVAESLTSLFIEENLKDREDRAADTSVFLDSQLEDAKRHLIEHEKKLEDYRLRFGAELPSQAPTNLQAMQNAQGQLQALADAADRARERRLLLERQLADLEAEPASELAAAAGEPGSTAQQLATAREQLQTLLGRAKPTHPDVRALQRTIRDLEAKADVEASKPPSAVPAKGPKLADLQRQKRRRDLTEQISDLDSQLAAKQRQESKLRSMIGQYEAQLDAVPKRESELVELTRDYATLQTTYQNLLSKRQDAKIASNLERKNIGPQFKVLDSPKVPERPFSPNRLLIVLGGAAGGLALGLLFAALLEFRDATFKSEEEVERVLNLRVLALVPVMVTGSDHRPWWRRSQLF